MLCALRFPGVPNRGVAGWSPEGDILSPLLAQATLRYVGRNFLRHQGMERATSTSHLVSWSVSETVCVAQNCSLWRAFCWFSHKNVTYNMFVEGNELGFFFLLENPLLMLEPSFLWRKSFVKFWLFLMLLYISGTEEVVPTKSNFTVENMFLFKINCPWTSVI